MLKICNAIFGYFQPFIPTALRAYLLNSVVLILPDLLCLCQLFLFQQGGTGDVSELPSSPQLGHQTPEATLPSQDTRESIRWGGEHTQTRKILQCNIRGAKCLKNWLRKQTNKLCTKTNYGVATRANDAKWWHAVSVWSCGGVAAHSWHSRGCPVQVVRRKGCRVEPCPRRTAAPPPGGRARCVWTCSSSPMTPQRDRRHAPPAPCLEYGEQESKVRYRRTIFFYCFPPAPVWFQWVKYNRKKNIRGSVNRSLWQHHLLFSSSTEAEYIFCPFTFVVVWFSH